MTGRSRIGVIGWLIVPALIGFSSGSAAQSGAASLHGWVAFENVEYSAPQPRADVELRHDPPGSSVVYRVTTDEHGFFNFSHTSLGRFTLHITAPNFEPYSAEVYMPSDFAGNWAVELRAKRVKVESREKKDR
ncbi:MAG: carboxypeptidase-like regulatory domain-containing protein [Thermoanaerobaculia bacterium]